MNKMLADHIAENQSGLSEDEIAEAIEAKREVVGVEMLPVMSTPTDIGALAVKLALADGSSTVMLIDARACQSIADIINDLTETGWQMQDCVTILGTKPN
jgi:hypothetical protein